MKGAHRTLDTQRSPRCKCKYCYRDGGSDGADLKQSAISRELRRVRARVLAQIRGDEVVEDTDDDAVIDADAVSAEVPTALPATDHGGHARSDDI
jgi:hypothetical protein